METPEEWAEKRKDWIEIPFDHPKLKGWRGRRSVWAPTGSEVTADHTRLLKFGGELNGRELLEVRLSILHPDGERFWTTLHFEPELAHDLRRLRQIFEYVLKSTSANDLDEAWQKASEFAIKEEELKFNGGPSISTSVAFNVLDLMLWQQSILRTCLEGEKDIEFLAKLITAKIDSAYRLGREVQLAELVQRFEPTVSPAQRRRRKGAATSKINRKKNAEDWYEAAIRMLNAEIQQSKTIKIKADAANYIILNWISISHEPKPSYDYLFKTLIPRWKKENRIIGLG